MLRQYKIVQTILSLIVISTVIFSNVGSVQGQRAQAQSGDGLKRQVNAESGRVSFIGPDNGRLLSASRALGTLARPQDPALALAKRYATEFGIQDPARDLSEIRNIRADDGRLTARYQQTYQGIPVMGGELIVNTNDQGDLYSMNGEISPDLSLPTQSAIDSAQAAEAALEVVAKWYQKSSQDFSASPPELWIFDESLLRPSTRPVELVWRTEVTANDAARPVRELVLVNAERGSISLHFNQIDHAWGTSPNASANVVAQDISPIETPTEVPVVTETPVPLETATPVPTNDATANQSTSEGILPLAANTWYVATTGNDGNSCSTTGSPCKTINGAIAKAIDNNGDTIRVATGTYTSSGAEVVLINKSITLSGGWNAGFTTQSEKSIIDGQNSRQVLNVSSGSVNLDRFIIQNGYYSAGIGGIVNGGVLVVNSSFIQSNRGGIWNQGNLTLNNVAVNNNVIVGVNGGGITNTGALFVNNSTISNNSSVDPGNGYGGHGGGIYNGYDGSVTINNSTISNNSVSIINGSGGGIYNSSFYGNPNVSIQNSILADNTAAFGPDCLGDNYVSIVSTGNNIISDADDWGCPSPTATDKFNISPMLGTFLSVQGYQPLLPGSPAINAGNSATCLSTDQRGLARVGTCDMGAYEYTSPGTAVSLSVVSGSGQHTPPNDKFLLPLKAAALDTQGSPVPNVNINFAAPASGASSSFASTGTYTSSVTTDSGGIATTSTLTANNQLGAYLVSASATGLSPVSFSLVNIVWYVSPSGNDANSCSQPASPCATISAAFNKSGFLAGDTVMVSQGAYTGSADQFVLTISKNLTLSGGWDSSFTGQTGFSVIDCQSHHSGIIVDAITNLDRFVIKNCINDIYGSGYGIYNGGNLIIRNSSIYNNVNGVSNYGKLSIINATISNNSGGGIYSNNSTLNAPNTALSLNNVTVTNNSSVYQGGGISLFYGYVTVQNSIIAGNTTTSSGPDCSGGFTSLGNNIIGNTAGCSVTAFIGDQFNVNPQLGAFNPTPGYYPLQLSSLAIDGGNPAACFATDQLGGSRPQGAVCDIGAIEYQFNHSANLLLKTYNLGNGTALPGTFLCDQTDLTCAAGDAQARAAHKFAAGTYDLYKNSLNRNSIDGNGIEILSTVHYDSNYDNAFWNGYMMIYGDKYGFALADDIVAHELTHGVTQYESNLFYYYQSGAINESLSDVFGEYYDQVGNVTVGDTAGVKWLIGEDIAGWTNPAPLPSLGLRSMSNPPAYLDPDKMSSPYYYEGDEDNGGVHYNSGVNNKATSLMVDGGNFNGRMVNPLGWTKVAAIYYEANRNLLTSGADYSDLYYALQQACTNLIGQKGIVAGDCVEVQDALDAVEMNGQPAPGFNADAPLCTVGQLNGTFLYDDMEGGTSNWTFTNGNSPRWQYDSPYGAYAHSSSHFLFADDYPASIADATARLAPILIPAGAYLHFAHAYDFEHYAPELDPSYYDGGVIEYSTNGGASWLDAGSFIDYNGYNGTVYSGFANPLSGRSAFVGTSHGYISTRLNLSSLAGQTVTFRWRMGLDDSGSSWGWWLDDVRIYKCAEVPSSWVGGVSITANKNVVAVGRPHIGSEVASYGGFSSGSLTAYVPMLFKTAFGGAYNAALYVQNVHAINTASVTIKFYDSSGALNCTKADTIAPLSSKGYWLPGVACDSGSLPTGWAGGVVVTSNQPIVAVGRPHVGSEVMTYDGFASGSLTSYIPMLFKGAFGGSYNAAFYIQNTHNTNTASITIKYYDSNGVLNCTKADTIAALASKGYWVPGATCDSGSLPAAWVGGVVVTSNQPIVAVGRPHIGSQVTTYNGFPAGSLSSYVPMLFKGAFGSYDSAFYVQNVHDTNTANVTIQYYDSNGNLNCTKADTIAPLASKGYWVPSATCDTGSLPAGWVGGVVVTSDQPIVAVGRPHLGVQVTTYNGFTSGSLSSSLPMLFKAAFGGSYNAAFYLQNTQNSAAAVTIKFYDTNGNLSCTRTDTIPALSTLGFWVPSVACDP